MYQMPMKKGRKSFTLIELLVVIAKYGCRKPL